MSEFHAKHINDIIHARKWSYTHIYILTIFNTFHLNEKAILRNMWSVLASNMGSLGAPKGFSVKATISSARTECLSR